MTDDYVYSGFASGKLILTQPPRMKCPIHGVLGDKYSWVSFQKAEGAKGRDICLECILDNPQIFDVLPKLEEITRPGDGK